MITAARADLLKLLAELSEQWPEVRLGQMIANLATLARGPEVESIWDSEDEELLAAAKQQLEVFLARRSSVA